MRVGGGVAEALHVWRYVLPKPLRRIGDRRGDLAALFLCVTPMWTLAALTLAVYFAYRPEFLLVDVAIPSAVTGALVSAAAACAAAARDAAITNTRDAATAGSPASHVVPAGGRASRTTSRESAVASGGWTRWRNGGWRRSARRRRRESGSVGGRSTGRSGRGRFDARRAFPVTARSCAEAPGTPTGEGARRRGARRRARARRRRFASAPKPFPETARTRRRGSPTGSTAATTRTTPNGAAEELTC